MLSREEPAALIGQRLGAHTLPPEVVELVYEKAQGHPLFCEELASAMREAGLIEVVGGDCRLRPEAGDLRAMNLPDTVQGAVTSRVDRLTPPEQLTLKVASVIGPTFSFRLLHEVYPIED